MGVDILTMTRDLQEIKKGIAQAKAALTLLEKFIAEYEGRRVNILPTEEVVFYKTDDDTVIAGNGFGQVDSLGQAIRECAEELAEIQGA